MQSLHGLEDAGIAHDKTKLEGKHIPDGAVTHHGVVRVDVTHIGIQNLLGLFITVELALSLEPFVVAATGYTVYVAQFCDGVLVRLLLYLGIHLLDHFLGISPSFRALRCFKRVTSAFFSASSRLRSSIWY